MSTNNAQTVELGAINQRGTIIEQRRTLTFPIPASVQDWTRIRFGIAISLTDLIEAEASLANLSSSHDVTDGTMASKFWFGLTTNGNGVLPATAGFAGEVFAGWVPRQDFWGDGTRLSANGQIGEFNEIGQGRSYFVGTVRGTDINVSSGDNNEWWNLVTDGELSRFRSSALSVLGYDFKINNRGEANQSINIHAFEYAGNQTSAVAALEIPYGEFSKDKLVTTTAAAEPNEQNGLSLNDGDAALPVPQNIIFHWPFFDRWRLRLHGACLIKRS